MVDPGETCGFARIWASDMDIRYWSAAITPGEVFAALTGDDHWDHLVIEEFRLFPWMAAQQGFSTVPTAEVIGALKYLAARRGVAWTMQKSMVMKEGRAFANKLKIPMTDRKLGSGKGAYIGPDFDLPGPPHPRDALAHGFYWLQHNSRSPLYEGDGK